MEPTYRPPDPDRPLILVDPVELLWDGLITPEQYLEHEEVWGEWRRRNARWGPRQVSWPVASVLGVCGLHALMRGRDHRTIARWLLPGIVAAPIVTHRGIGVWVSRALPAPGARRRPATRMLARD